MWAEVWPQNSLTLGLSSFTMITNFGSSAGPNHANEAKVDQTHFSYIHLVDIWLVPVFHPALYPGIYPFCATQFASESTSIEIIISEVDFLITLCFFSVWYSIILPSHNSISSTIRGVIYIPPFTSVEYAVAIWIGVTQIPRPYELVNSLALDHFSWLSISRVTSPPSVIHVVWEKPNLLRYSYAIAFPYLWAIRTIHTLQL